MSKKTRLKLVSSAITLSEVSGAISRRTGAGKMAIDYTKEIYAFPNLIFIPLTLPITKKSYLNAAKYKLRGIDAIHFTCASIAKTDFFVTLDNKFSQKIKSSIEVLTPKELLAKTKLTDK